jgi:cell division septal protein FtsQ
MKKKATLYVFGVIIAIGLFLFVQKRIKVNEVRCLGCSSEIASLVDEKKGTSYFEAKRSLSSSFKENRRVNTYKIKYIMPSTLQVELVEKKEELALKFADDRYFLFDQNAVLLGEATETRLPTIQILELPRNDHMVNGLKLFSQLKKHYGVTNAKMDKFGLSVSLREAKEVVFPLEGDIDVVLGSLEVVLLQLNRVTQNHTIVVDLRYKNPVVSSYE